MPTATDNSTATEKPSFTLLIDPPGCSYERSSDGLIYALQAWAKLIEDINPGDPVNDRALTHLCLAMQPSLLLITDQLIGRLGCNIHLERQIADLIVLAGQKEGAK